MPTLTPQRSAVFGWPLKKANGAPMGECCCVDFCDACTDCASAAQGMTVTGTGSGIDPEMLGGWDWDTFLSGDPCYWKWVHPDHNDWFLGFGLDPDTCEVFFLQDIQTQPVMNDYTVSSSLTCISGVLGGSVTFTGTGGDTGKSLTITL
jgi:hypothetical protein